MTVWFITGVSRGFGIEITRQALGRGDQVVATSERSSQRREHGRPAAGHQDRLNAEATSLER